MKHLMEAFCCNFEIMIHTLSLSGGEALRRTSDDYGLLSTLYFVFKPFLVFHSSLLIMLTVSLETAAIHLLTPIPRK